MITEMSFKSLPGIYKLLLQEADNTSKSAYNPYSGFFVGAALLTASGTIFTGSNVENAAYGSTICAERAAILSANSKGYRNFESLAVIGKGKNFDCVEVISPCGSCRQMLNELTQISGIDMKVIMSNTRMNKIVVANMSDLLPFAFGPKDLGLDVTSFR